MPIKLKDIAKKANVSEGTASLALNGSKLVNALTREKIIRISKELKYLPNAMAKGLAKSKSNTLGLIIPDIEDAYYSRLVRFIDENIKNAGYNLVLAISNDNPETEKKIIKNFICERVDGIIIAPVNHNNLDIRYLADLEKHHIPHIFVTAFYPNLDASYVMSNLEEGSYKIVKYLIELGHRDIYFLVGPRLDVVSSEFRINGYMRAFKEYGLEVDIRFIVDCTRYDYDFAYEATERIIRSNKPDAIITINDTMALAVINALKANGLSVPQDISVAGYDDMFFSTISSVPITTVKQDILKISRNAVDILLRKIESASMENEKILIKTELIIRDSTGVKR